jgi:hypothetical protein
MLSCVEGSCIPLNKYTFGCIWKKIWKMLFSKNFLMQEREE